MTGCGLLIESAGLAGFPCARKGADPKSCTTSATITTPANRMIIAILPGEAKYTRPQELLKFRAWFRRVGSSHARLSWYQTASHLRQARRPRPAVGRKHPGGAARGARGVARGGRQLQGGPRLHRPREGEGGRPGRPHVDHAGAAS